MISYLIFDLPRIFKVERSDLIGIKGFWWWIN